MYAIRSYYAKFYTHFVGRANAVTDAYKKISPLLSLLACLAYVGATVLMIP